MLYSNPKAVTSSSTSEDSHPRSAVFRWWDCGRGHLLSLEFPFSNVVDRDLEPDREVEHFAEPHTHTVSRPSSSDLGLTAPQINMAPTNREKSDHEETIQCVLEKRERENIRFYNLVLEFSIPKATLYNSSQSIKSCQRARENYSPRTEDAPPQ